MEKQKLDQAILDIIRKAQKPNEFIYVGPGEIYGILHKQGVVVHLDELADSLRRLESEGWIERGMVYTIRKQEAEDD